MDRQTDRQTQTHTQRGLITLLVISEITYISPRNADRNENIIKEQPLHIHYIPTHTYLSSFGNILNPLNTKRGYFNIIWCNWDNCTHNIMLFFGVYNTPKIRSPTYICNRNINLSVNWVYWDTSVRCILFPLLIIVHFVNTEQICTCIHYLKNSTHTLSEVVVQDVEVVVGAL